MPAAAPSWPQSGTLLPSCWPHPAPAPAPAPSQWAWSPHSRAGLLGWDTGAGAGVTGTDVVQGVGDNVAEVAPSSVDAAVVFSAVVCSIVVAVVGRVVAPSDVVGAGEGGAVTALVSPRMVSALRHVSLGHDVSTIIIIGPCTAHLVLVRTELSHADVCAPPEGLLGAAAQLGAALHAVLARHLG